MTCNSREQRELWRERGGQRVVAGWVVARKATRASLAWPSLRVLFANNSILFVRRVVPSLSTVSKPEEILIITRDCVFPVTYFARVPALHRAVFPSTSFPLLCTLNIYGILMSYRQIRMDYFIENL